MIQFTSQSFSTDGHDTRHKVVVVESKVNGNLKCTDSLDDMTRQDGEC